MTTNWFFHTFISYFCLWNGRFLSLKLRIRISSKSKHCNLKHCFCTGSGDDSGALRWFHYKQNSHSPAPVPGLLWLTGGPYTLCVLEFALRIRLVNFCNPLSPTPRDRFLYFCDWQAAHMLFVFSGALSCAGSWTFVIDRRRVYSSYFSNNFPCARSWTFVIDGWRVYSPCFE